MIRRHLLAIGLPSLLLIAVAVLLVTGCAPALEAEDVTQLRVRVLGGNEIELDGEVGQRWAERLTTAFEAQEGGTTELCDCAEEMWVTLARTGDRDLELARIADGVRASAVGMPVRQYGEGPLSEALDALQRDLSLDN